MPLQYQDPISPKCSGSLLSSNNNNKNMELFLDLPMLEWGEVPWAGRWLGEAGGSRGDV